MNIISKAPPNAIEGYVQLTPNVDFSVECPHCGQSVEANGWKLTGWWTLAQFGCKSCGHTFLFDLPYALGLVIPCYLDLDSASAKPKCSGQWYADLTTSALREKQDLKSCVTVERSDYGATVCLVNCLYPWWGDAVGLLLRVNQLKRSDMGIVVLINPALRWLVPDYVGGVWVVDQSVKSNSNWNEALDAEVKRIVKSEGLRAYLPRTFQPAYLTPEELEVACKIKPFPRHQWDKRLEEAPRVTFMSRSDRTWAAHKQLSVLPERLQEGFRSFCPRIARRRFHKRAVRVQTANIILLADELKKIFANLEFTVCGVGREGVLPAWIKDLRVDEIGEDTNRLWALQGSQSHIVCGVTGSHLTIPGSLAGSYVELVPAKFLPNILTCASVTSREPREAIYSHRLLPGDTDPSYLTMVISTMLLNYSYVRLAFGDKYYSPLRQEAISMLRNKLEERRSSLARVSRDFLNKFAN